MRPLKDMNTQFEEKGHRMLLGTLLLVIFVSPFLHQERAAGLVLTVFVVMVLLAAVKIVSGQSGEFRLAMIFGVLAVLPQFGILVERIVWLEILRYAATVLFLGWVCGLLLRDIVVRSREVTRDLILGAVNVYLMAGMAFAFLYGLIEKLQPGSFAGADLQLSSAAEVLPFLYFSFVTLTTLGYGDITPLTPLGTTVSYFEAMFGQLYLAVMVARLVGLYIARQQNSS